MNDPKTQALAVINFLNTGLDMEKMISVVKPDLWRQRSLINE